jgi:hypothetical protein
MTSSLSAPKNSSSNAIEQLDTDEPEAVIGEGAELLAHASLHEQMARPIDSCEEDHQPEESDSGADDPPSSLLRQLVQDHAVERIEVALPCGSFDLTTSFLITGLPALADS